eukprot:Awhi_evm1s5617
MLSMPIQRPTPLWYDLSEFSHENLCAPLLQNNNSKNNQREQSNTTANNDINCVNNNNNNNTNDNNSNNSNENSDGQSSDSKSSDKNALEGSISFDLLANVMNGKDTSNLMSHSVSSLANSPLMDSTDYNDHIYQNNFKQKNLKKEESLTQPQHELSENDLDLKDFSNLDLFLDMLDSPRMQESSYNLNNGFLISNSVTDFNLGNNNSFLPSQQLDASSQIYQQQIIMQQPMQQAYGVENENEQHKQNPPQLYSKTQSQSLPLSSQFPSYMNTIKENIKWQSLSQARILSQFNSPKDVVDEALNNIYNQIEYDTPSQPPQLVSYVPERESSQSNTTSINPVSSALISFNMKGKKNVNKIKNLPCSSSTNGIGKFSTDATHSKTINAVSVDNLVSPEAGGNYYTQPKRSLMFINYKPELGGIKTNKPRGRRRHSTTTIKTY